MIAVGALRWCAAFALLTSSPGCSDAGRTNGPPTPVTALRAELVVSGLESPVYLTAPAGDPRLFVVEQGGRVQVVKGGALLPTPFLDVTGRIASGGERGLLSIAFHPRYASNGVFYAYFNNPAGDIRVVRYHASPASDVADATAGDTILAIPHPTYANHNGGLLLFGPDGKLYIGTGDGGGGGDPFGNAQNTGVLLGKLLRLDVDAGTPYGIPADNPFASQPGARGEIWAYGLRNPWRFAFDRVSGLLYIADVGQNAWEEVDVAPSGAPGLNYGWNIMEGTHCYQPSCNGSGYTAPVLDYGHDEGCAIGGGSVYRGRAMPALAGTYFYSDYCAGWIRSFRYTNGVVQARTDWQIAGLGSVLSFGEDASGELYILTASGRILRLVGA